MNKTYLENLLKEHSIRDISEISNKSFSTIRYWMKKYQLKSIYNKFGEKNSTKISGLKSIKKKNFSPESLKYIEKRTSKAEKLPLSEINTKIAEGLTWKEIRNKYNLCYSFLTWLFKNKYLEKLPQEKLKLIQSKNQTGKKHSNETKIKLSKARKKYLKENGLKPFYNVKQQKTSWLCETVKQELKSKGIIFVEEFMPLKEQGRYFAIDIAIINQKLAFEINGGQHYNEYGELLPYYQNRHDLIVKSGWKVYEIRYNKNYMNIVNFIIKEIQSQNQN